MTEFIREHDRYIVIKRSDISNNQAMNISGYLIGQKITPRECVVVESDWPIYEEVWKMVERMANNITQSNQECNRDTEIQVCHKEIDDLLNRNDILHGELKEAATLIAKQSEAITRLKQENDDYQLLVPSLDKLVQYTVDKQLGTAGEDAVDVIIRYCEELREDTNDPNPKESGFYKILAHKKGSVLVAHFNTQVGWSFVAQTDKKSNVYRVIEKVEV